MHVEVVLRLTLGLFHQSIDYIGIFTIYVDLNDRFDNQSSINLKMSGGRPIIFKCLRSNVVLTRSRAALRIILAMRAYLFESMALAIKYWIISPALAPLLNFLSHDVHFLKDQHYFLSGFPIFYKLSIFQKKFDVEHRFDIGQ